MDDSEDQPDIVTAFINHLDAFIRREREDCPRCAQTVVRLDQVRRSVYASPCGCRIMQGRVPVEWK